MRRISPFYKKPKQAATALIILFGAIGISGADISFPFTFSSGQPIRAAELNSNFSAIKTELGKAPRVLTRTTLLNPTSLGFTGTSVRRTLPQRTLTFTKSNPSTHLSINYRENLFVTASAVNYWVYCKVRDNGNTVVYDKATIRAAPVPWETLAFNRTYEVGPLPAGQYTTDISIFAFQQLDSLFLHGTDSNFEASLSVSESL